MQLLVSVVDPREVAAVLAGGADVIDVKDPAHGSLGAPTPAVLRSVRAAVPPGIACSAALGDVPHLPGTLALAAYAAADCGAEWVKVGPLDPSPERATELLRAVREGAEAARPATRTVAVAYADAARIGALPPAEIPALAAAAGVFGVLLDTAVKDGTSSLAALGETEIARLLDDARARGLFTGLAGSLALEDLPRVRRLAPDLVGVRGSACDGGRAGRVSAARVRATRAALELEGAGLNGEPEAPRS